MRWDIVLVTLGLVNCGGQAEPGTLTPQTLVAQISPNEEKQLCDWWAGLYGGYGAILDCDSGATGLGGPASEQECVQQLAAGLVGRGGMFSQCPATVEQVEACLTWRASTACSTSAGAPPSECTVVDGPQCSSP